LSTQRFIVYPWPCSIALLTIPRNWGESPEPNLGESPVLSVPNPVPPLAGGDRDLGELPVQKQVWEGETGGESSLRRLVERANKPRHVGKFAGENTFQAQT
jgi:hypothetical protein